MGSVSEVRIPRRSGDELKIANFKEQNVQQIQNRQVLLTSV